MQIFRKLGMLYAVDGNGNWYHRASTDDCWEPVPWGDVAKWTCATQRGRECWRAFIREYFALAKEHSVAPRRLAAIKEALEVKP